MFLTEDSMHIPCITGKFPGVVPVDVEDPDDVEAEHLVRGHILEVEVEELLFGRVEPEPREVEF